MILKRLRLITFESKRHLIVCRRAAIELAISGNIVVVVIIGSGGADGVWRCDVTDTSQTPVAMAAIFRVAARQLCYNYAHADEPDDDIIRD